MWGLERLTNVPKWRPLNSWCMKVLSSEGFAHGKLVGAPRHNLIGWWGVLWKNEIRGFWDVRVGKAYKCPQMKTIKFLVNESFEFRGFCTWPRLAVHHGIARWLGGEFCSKMKFVIFELWGLERPTNVPKWIPWNSWCTKVLSSEGLSLGQVCRCIVALPYGLVGSFVKKWNSWFLRSEGWKGLQMSPNEYHEILGAWKFWVRRGLHMARLSVHHGITWLVGGEFCEKMKFVVFEMWGLERLTNYPKWSPLNSWCMKVLSSEGFSHGKLVGAPRHNLIGWWGVLWKNEIRGFWDVRVGKAYKCPQMKTIKFLVNESFEFGGFCTWPWLAVHHGIGRWLGGEFC